MKLQEKLFSLRKARGLSQLKLAEKVGVSRQAISRWEAGVAMPTTENLKCLGELYNVSLEYLLNDDAAEPGDRDGKERSQDARKNLKNVGMLLVVVGTLAVIFCTIFFMNSSETPKQMDDIERSEVEPENINNFKLEF